MRPILERLREGGVPVLANLRPALDAYRIHLAQIDPDSLERSNALAYWLNLYNAGALDAAARTSVARSDTVLRLPGAFDAPFVEVAGEHLSLDDVEHGKIRRFGDPRIHGALVCGSASCPTLRYEPYSGVHLDNQLDDQLCSFLRNGGAIAERTGSLMLSRVFLWYGGDFTRTRRMPTWLPAGRRRLAAALRPWLPADIASWVDETRPTVRFQPYDWSLACAVGA